MATKQSPKLIQKNQLTSIQQGLQLVAFGLIVILGIRFIAQDVVAPLLLALFLTALISPLFGWFRKRGFSPVFSVIFMILTLLLTLAAFIIFFSWAFSILNDYLAEFINSFKANVSEVSEQVGLSTTSTEDLTSWLTPEVVLNFFGTIISNFNGIMLYLFIVPVLAILLMLQIDSIPSDSKADLVSKNKFLQKLSKFGASVIVYLNGRFKVNLLTGAGFALALLFLGVPFPFLWGISTVILCFVPYIGLFLAGFAPTVIAFSQGGLLSAILVIVAICVINLITENILEPMIQGRGNRISAAALVIAFIFWTWLFGPIGAILTAPLTVLLKLILADYRETAWLASLMEGNYSQNPQSKSALNKLKSLLGGLKVPSFKN